MALEAKPDCCEEAAPVQIPIYVPCNEPAVQNVYSPKDRRVYRMCAGCADHNIRHRGCEDRGPYVQLANR